jgi:hypothetical protein
MQGTCANCKRKKVEVRRVATYMLCQPCWAGSPQQIRVQYPVFKLTFIQKMQVKFEDWRKRMRQSKQRMMTTKEREASNHR